MTNSITPSVVDNIVLEFCSSIVNNAKPIFIDVIPEHYSTVDNCLINVPEKMSRDGGKQINGWLIWLWPSIYIEGVYHSVWCSPTNKLIDVTPKLESVETILFVPDDNTEYAGRQVNNQRMSLTKNGMVGDLFAVADATFYHTNHGERALSHQLHLQGEDLEIMKWLEIWKQGILMMLEKGESKGGPCPCKSGRKYKRCCRLDFEDGINRLKQRYGF